MSAEPTGLKQLLAMPSSNNAACETSEDGVAYSPQNEDRASAGASAYLLA
jgi:hypothetical protein